MHIIHILHYLDTPPVFAVSLVAMAFKELYGMVSVYSSSVRSKFIQNFTLWYEQERSLMWIEQDNGPNIDPCGTAVELLWASGCLV